MIDLHGSDADGNSLTYGYRAMDLTDVDGHAEVTRSPTGAGVFRWTPLGPDVGLHMFEFTATDGSHIASAMVNIDVRSSIGAATAPVFRQPSGGGTTIDLTKQACIDLDVVVADSDTARVKMVEDEPMIDGATLQIHDGLTATWHWCPTREQQSESRYMLVLDADDGDNPRTIKNYLVVVSGGSGAACPGAPPVIVHTPHDVSSILDVTLDATVTDDKGVKDPPLLYYATSAPASPPDLTRMTMLTTATVSGDHTNGVYRATVPNPVAEMPAGTKQTLYYVFVAKDDDDTTGTCDHQTISPVYTTTVTSTGTADLPICAPCTTDAQCGTGDECVRIGSAGASYCLQACGTGCPTGYTCSTTPQASVDGKMALQCVPNSGSCTTTTTSCMDDTWEVNDDRSAASQNPALTPDLYDLVSCPSTTSTTRANDDWFKIVVPSDQRVDLQLAGGTQSDLDLHLYHSDGTVISASTSFEANEEISACLPAATYYVKVNGYGSARNPYLLSYDTHAESCNTTCVDDIHEDDDTYSQAREVVTASYSSTGTAICPGDDDWFHVRLVTGQVMTVDLTFTQANAAQDLDLHLYKNSLDLTPCDTSNPASCSIAAGQGGVSNEHTTFTTPAGCTAGCDYYVVVRGYNHSANTYGIAIHVQ